MTPQKHQHEAWMIVDDYCRACGSYVDPRAEARRQVLATGATLAQELELFRTGFGSFVALDKAFSEMGVAMEMARHTQS
jgi:hypothetical protein